MNRGLIPGEALALKRWVAEKGLAANQSLTTFEAMKGDASLRCYFEVSVACDAQTTRLVAVYAPPDSQNNQGFLHVANLLVKAGVNVPVIYACDTDKGYWLLEHLGHEQLFTLLQGAVDTPKAEQWLSQAMDHLLGFCRMDITDDPALPEYQAKDWQRELSLFEEWFVGRYLGLTLKGDVAVGWSEITRLLINNALDQPQIFMHRDYHSRNLMMHNDALYVIDFQDAARGPVTYDLISLLTDCYVNLPEVLTDRLLMNFYHRLERVNPALVFGGLSAFRQAARLMSMQRHLKILGIFSRLSIAEGKDNYLQYLPDLLESVTVVARELGETAFADYATHQLQPLLLQKQRSKAV